MAKCIICGKSSTIAINFLDKKDEIIDTIRYCQKCFDELNTNVQKTQEKHVKEKGG